METKMYSLSLCSLLVTSMFLLGTMAVESAVAAEEGAPRTVVIVMPSATKATGDATAEDVLEGTTFSNADAVGVSGTMPNQGANGFTPSASVQTIPVGYYDGKGTIDTDPNLVPENICSGFTIFGVTGTTLCNTVTSADGKIWMDRNLGASQIATSVTDTLAYGDLYQWGRLADGHEKISSGKEFDSLSDTDVPGHSRYIMSPDTPYDWRAPQNDALWQGVSGINNPCPSGFRLPTEAEWETERQSWSPNNAAGAFASPLKLVAAGMRSPASGEIQEKNEKGYYWSSTVDGTNSVMLLLHIYDDDGPNAMVDGRRATGTSIRCIKDY